MNLECREIERTDRVGRESAAARSLARWFQRESETINRAIQIGREHIAAGQGDIEQTRRSVTELEQQRQNLYAGWEKSTLRRHIEQRSVTTDADERRSAPTMAACSSLTTGSRAADAATTTSTMIAKRIEGYAAVYDTLSPNWAGFREKIERGAFTKAIANSDVRLLFNHDNNHLFARSSAATLELKEDSHGLHFRAYLLPFDGPSYGLARRIDRGDLTGCSFSFSGVTDEWILKPGEVDVRVLKKIDHVYDLGPVTYPWYPTTIVSAVFESVQRTAPDVPPTRTVPTRRHPATLADRLYAKRQLDQARFEWESKNWALVQKEKSYWRAMGLSEQAAAKKIDLIFQKHVKLLGWGRPGIGLVASF